MSLLHDSVDYSGSHFQHSAEELVQLTENDKDGKDQMDKLGGVAGVLKILKTDPEKGLSGESFRDRIEHFGENVLPMAPETSFITLYFRALQDATIIILLICAIISLILGIFFPPHGEEGTAWIEGAAILAAVVLVTLVTSLNEYSQEKQFRKLNKRAEDRQIIVIRNGKQSQINISEVVVGDICVLNTGDRTPCDGVMVFANDLKMDESNMTGESESVTKDVENRWRVLCGFQVTDGNGLFVATAVGPNTLWGKTVAQLSTPPDPTPLQDKLDSVAKTIGLLGTGAAVLVFIILMIYYFIDLGKPDYYFDWSQMNRVMDAFILSVTIVVVAVPEGLPLAVTISLAYSMKYMVEDNNLVRKLAACETLGGATDICSDKTGTLTLNQMTVMRAWIAGEEFDDMHSVQVTPALKTLLEESISINTTVITKMEKGKKEYIGNKTEGALLGFQEILGSADYDYIRKKNKVVKNLPFSSARKKMFSVVKRGNNYRLYCKGAPERIIADCVGIVDPEGNLHELSDEGKVHITKIVDRFANTGYRTLCIAYKDIDEHALSQDVETLDRDMYITAVFGIEDPIRPEVPLAVKQCQNAGVYVRMVTGDNIHTASVIARRCKILKDNGVAVEGPEFSKMSDEEIDRLIPSLQVLARSSPLDKLRLVQRLRANKHVVGVTGDGTNDAAALKEADVGLAMGIAGTEVAKQAADIIILDDNFKSIVLAIMWGRCIFDNICKFLQFQLTVNVVAVIIAVIGALGFQSSPLTAVQLLWVNLIMDSLAALALGTERPNPELLDRYPVNLKKAWILSNSMMKHIAGQSIYQIIILLGILYFGISIFEHLGMDFRGNQYEHYTIIFNSFVFCQIFNIFNCRSIVDREFNIFKGIQKNYFFACVVVFIVVVQILIVFFGGEVFQTSPITWQMWLLSIIIGAISIPLGLFLRLIRVPKKDGCGYGYSRKFDPEAEYLLGEEAA